MAERSRDGNGGWISAVGPDRAFKTRTPEPFRLVLSRQGLTNAVMWSMPDGSPVPGPPFLQGTAAGVVMVSSNGAMYLIRSRQRLTDYRAVTWRRSPVTQPNPP